MRLASLALVFALATAATAQTTEDRTHIFDQAGFSATLPAGFALEQSLTERLPDFGAFLFVDEAVGTIAVEVHTYFGSEQQAAHLRGESAAQELAHLPSVERGEVSGYGVEAGSAFRFGDETYRGVALYGCDEVRCYKVSATAADESTLASLVGGVTFEG